MERDYLLAAGAETLNGLGGVDWGDLFFKRSAERRMRFCDGRVESVSGTFGAGCSARFLKGRGTAIAAVSGVGAEAVARAWDEAARLAGFRAPSLPEGVFPLERPRVFFPDEWDFCREIDAELRRECRWIRQVSVSCSSSAFASGVATPEGFSRCEGGFCSFGVEVVLERGGRVESGYGSYRRKDGAEKYFADLDPRRVARGALEEALLNMEAVECPTGTMPVVLSDRAGGTMIHEACGHGMEADLVFEEQSCFAGKLGDRVAAECVTVIDDATLPGRWGSYPRDDEGTPSARNVLIENGVLKRYLTDRRCSMLYGLPRTGNARRDRYSSAPQPRMSNTFVAPGDGDPGAMIAGVARGLYVRRMGGGEVNTTTGEFAFDVTRGYMIEDGRVTRPVKGALLIGTGLEALRGIRSVGRDLRLAPGICEKGGQDVPVTDGQPSLLIEGLVVGGTATE